MQKEKITPIEKPGDQAPTTNGRPPENLEEQSITPHPKQPGTSIPDVSKIPGTVQEQAQGTPATGLAEREISHVKTDAKMEIHHSHTPDHPKKWKDYLFEFFMLFLAITTGFFVENQREHYIEDMRAAQFSKQLLADLRLDSIFFVNRNEDLKYKQQGHDKLLYLLTEEVDADETEILETLLPVTFAYDLPVTPQPTTR
jgi:hypothetical protein